MPLGHEMGEAPCAQVTLQRPTWSVHKTWQLPWHATTQLVALEHVIMLPGPACTPHRCMPKHV